MKHSKGQIVAFAEFVAKHLIALPYVEGDPVVFLPVLMGREFRHILGLNPDYSTGTWVSIGFDSNVSAAISKED